MIVPLVQEAVVRALADLDVAVVVPADPDTSAVNGFKMLLVDYRRPAPDIP